MTVRIDTLTLPIEVRRQLWKRLWGEVLLRPRPIATASAMETANDNDERLKAASAQTLTSCTTEVTR